MRAKTCNPKGSSPLILVEGLVCISESYRQRRHLTELIGVRLRSAQNSVYGSLDQVYERMDVREILLKRHR